MKKLLLILALSIGLLVCGLGVGTSSADAACGTKCLNKKVKNLQGQVGTLRGQVGTLQGQVTTLNTQLGTANSQLSCMSTAVPVTQYDGYDFLELFFTTALDITEPGDQISFWVPRISPGTCNLPTVRTAAASSGNPPSGFTPFQPGPPQTKK